DIRSFSVGVFEISVAEWQACVDDEICKELEPIAIGLGDGAAGTNRRPALAVSWNDARDYVQWLRLQSGREYRLLTEAEWEFAARAGTMTAYSWGDDGPAACDFTSSNGATLNEFSCPGETSIGSYSANAFGLFDVHGNAYEWVEDCASESYVGAPVDGSPDLSGDCTRRVMRGGSYASGPDSLRSASRAFLAADVRDLRVGFRVARER
ncbi:MAG: formylglycine-generating enzyme family protein, partial [Pseudomonadota bacterium]